MEREMTTVEVRTADTGNFGLLRYEIERAKNHLETQGESPVMRERLHRLEDLLETCLSHWEAGS